MRATPATAAGIVAIALHGAAMPALACTKEFPLARATGLAHFVVSATPDTLHAGAGSVRSVAAPGHFGQLGERHIYGQLFILERVGGNAARQLPQGTRRVIVVPWDYGPDCRPAPWMRSAQWVEPGTRSLLIAALRDPGEWLNGMPTFDMHAPESMPYPQKPERDFSRRRLSVSLLTIDELFTVLDRMPEVEDLRRGSRAAVEPLLKWVRANSHLSERYPLASGLRSLGYSVVSEEIRATASPIAGTYRFTWRLEDSVGGTFYLRTRVHPRGAWPALRMPQRSTDLPERPPGTTTYAVAALMPDSLPTRCRASEPVGTYIGSLQSSAREWGGKIELAFLTRLFPGDGNLARVIAELGQFRGRPAREGPPDAPARFFYSLSGELSVEQLITLSDGRKLALTGSRISTEAIACPP